MRRAPARTLSALLLGVLCLPAAAQSTRTAPSIDLSETPAVAPPPIFPDSDPMAGLLRFLSRESLPSPYNEDWMYFQYLGQLQSYVGRYQEALASFDKVEDAPPPSKADFGGAKPEPALDAIARAAESRRAVFINEAHHVPRHREFTTRLLKRLYGQGYRYFAAEALGARDMAWNDSRVPLLGRRNGREPAGPYTDEPLCGDMVRTALRLGYTIVAYEEEDGGPCENPPEDKQFCQNRRERVQARNLKTRVFDKDPGAKVLVHAGYGHIDKVGAEGWNPMAKYFKELTGIEPFSVDQTAVREHATPKLEDPAYAAAVSEFKPKEPVALRRPDGSCWVRPVDRGHYDMQVVHPRSRTKRGRPGWLVQGGRRLVAVPEALCGAARPCLVQAFYEGEPEDAVPVDRVMSDTDGGLPALALPKGSFKVRASDSSGKLLSSRVLRVD